MTIQKVKSGQPVYASMMNQIIDRLPAEQFGANGQLGVRLVLCRATEAILAATIDESDTEDSVYPSGLVDTYGLLNNGDGTFSPGVTSEKRILVNASRLAVALGDEVWAVESWDGLLVLSQPQCRLYQYTLKEAWTSGSADADILEMDGTDTGFDAEVRDPQNTFASLGSGDSGYCWFQGGEYYATQAPCPS